MNPQAPRASLQTLHLALASVSLGAPRPADGKEDLDPSDALLLHLKPAATASDSQDLDQHLSHRPPGSATHRPPGLIPASTTTQGEPSRCPND